MTDVNYIVVDGLKVGANSIRYWREQLELQTARIRGLRGHLSTIGANNTESPETYARIALELDATYAQRNGAIE